MPKSPKSLRPITEIRRRVFLDVTWVCRYAFINTQVLSSLCKNPTVQCTIRVCKQSERRFSVQTYHRLNQPCYETFTS